MIFLSPDLLLSGRYRFYEPFWVNIDRACNHLVPVCGAKKNSSDFTVTVTSDYFNTDITPVTVVSSPFPEYACMHDSNKYWGTNGMKYYAKVLFLVDLF